MENRLLPSSRFCGALLTTFDKWLALVSRILHWMSSLALVAMFLLIVADIIGIKVFARPIPGGIEVVGFLAALTIGGAIAAVNQARGHIAVDFVLGRLSPRARTSTEVFVGLLSCVLLGILMVFTWRYAGDLHASGEVSMTQRIPYYPFVYFLTVCYAVVFISVIGQSVKAILEAHRTWSR